MELNVFKILGDIYEKLSDKSFLSIDKRNIKRTKNIKWIPQRGKRWGGKISYAEWAHVIGLFQTLICQETLGLKSPKILDVGCGNGLLGISSIPYIMDGGSYTGLDVMKVNIDFCNSYFTEHNMDFVHLNANNPSYASDQDATSVAYPMGDNTFDLVTALSVWTHLSEQDSIYYLKEVGRVLKSGGKCILTCWYLIDDYDESKLSKIDKSRFNSGKPSDKIFSEKAYESDNWRTLSWVENPEQVCGVTPEGMKILLEASGLSIEKYYPGNWKELGGLYYQDVLVLKKI